MPLLPGTRKLYVYQRPGFRLVVYRDRLILYQHVPVVVSVLPIAFDTVLHVRCRRGWLQIQLVGGTMISYHLGQVAQEVCELIAGLL